MGKRESLIAKGIAIAMMLFHHLFLNEQEISAHGGNLTLLFLSQDQLISIAQSFKVCVSVFVLISGYGMCLKLRGSGGEGRYAASKIVKLLMNFQVVFVLFALIGLLYPIHNVTTVYGDLHDSQSLMMLGIDFFGLASAFQTPTLNATWWYMSVAVLLILIAPIVRECGKKFGYGTVAGISLIGPLLMGLISTYAFRYLFVFCIGMLLAENGLLDRYSSWKKNERRPKQYLLISLTLVSIVALLYLRQKVAWCDSMAVLIEAVCAVAICALATVLPSKIGSALFVIGNHSMNIFLLHTFVFGYYWSQMIYMWNYPILIFIVLLVLSLAISWAIEKCKAFTGFDRMVEMVSSRVSALPEFKRMEG